LHPKLPYPSAPSRQSGIASQTLQEPEDNSMKNPLDSLWGTVISGLVLTVVLYFFTVNFLLKAAA